MSDFKQQPSPAIFVCLFELMLNVPVDSYGHVKMLPPFYGDFNPELGCHGIQKVLQIPNLAMKAYMYGWFYLNHVSWAGSDMSG